MDRINLGDEHHIIRLNELIPADLHPTSGCLAEALASWLAEDWNPELRLPLDLETLMDNFQRALALKQYKLDKAGALEATVCEPWEDEALKAGLPTFKKDTAKAFKAQWKASAAQAALAGQKPLWLEGDGPNITRNVTEELGDTSKIDYKELNKRAQYLAACREIRERGWFSRLLAKEPKSPGEYSSLHDSFIRILEEEAAVPVSPVMATLFRVYRRVAQWREIGEELCKLGEEGDEIYAEGLRHLAEAYGLQQVLNRKAFGLAAQLTVEGILLSDRGLEDMAQDMEEALSHNPVAKIHALTTDLSHRLNAAAEVSETEVTPAAKRPTSQPRKVLQ